MTERDQPVATTERELPDALVLMGVAWFLSTFVASFAWVTHFGWPHVKGNASTGAVAVTGAIFALLGVLFLVSCLTEIVRRS